ncbi:MAG: hypothetical protein ACRDQ2_08385 [Gaiellales bacterium]
MSIEDPLGEAGLRCDAGERFTYEEHHLAGGRRGHGKTALAFEGDRASPPGAAGSGGDDDPRRRMALLDPVRGDHVAGGLVGLMAEEDLVQCDDALPVVQGGLNHRADLELAPTGRSVL